MTFYSRAGIGDGPFVRRIFLRRPLLPTIWNRVAEIHADDSFIAFKHVYRAGSPSIDFQTAGLSGVPQDRPQWGAIVCDESASRALAAPRWRTPHPCVSPDLVRRPVFLAG